MSAVAAADVVALQRLLMHTTKRYVIDVDPVAASAYLQHAAGLDYALMLASGTARIPLDENETKAGIEQTVPGAVVAAIEACARFVPPTDLVLLIDDLDALSRLASALSLDAEAAFALIVLRDRARRA